MLCADMVNVQWKDKSGRTRKLVANLEDISISGACLQLDVPVPLQTVMRITYRKGKVEGKVLGRLEGKVQYCVYHQIGYFVGVEFGEGYRWSQREFKPQHMVDPRRLTVRAVKSKKVERIGVQPLTVQ